MEAPPETTTVTDSSSTAAVTTTHLHTSSSPDTTAAARVDKIDLRIHHQDPLFTGQTLQVTCNIKFTEIPQSIEVRQKKLLSTRLGLVRYCDVQSK